jgi:hypothetical protein
MEAVAWTAIGMLGATLVALVGAAFQLNLKIDAQGRDVGARVDAVGARIDAVGARVDAVSSNLGARIDALHLNLVDRIDALGSRIDAHLERHTG